MPNNYKNTSKKNPLRKIRKQSSRNLREQSTNQVEKPVHSAETDLEKFIESKSPPLSHTLTIEFNAAQYNLNITTLNFIQKGQLRLEFKPQFATNDSTQPEYDAIVIKSTHAFVEKTSVSEVE